MGGSANLHPAYPAYPAGHESVSQLLLAQVWNVWIQTPADIEKKCRRSGANINHNTTLAIATRPQLFGPVQSSTTFRQRKNVRPWKVWTNWRTEDPYGLCQWACMTDLMMFNVLNKHRNCVCNHSNLKALASRDSCGVQRNLCQCAARR